MLKQTKKSRALHLARSEKSERPTVKRYVESSPFARPWRRISGYTCSSYLEHRSGKSDALVYEAPVWARPVKTKSARRKH